MHNTKINYLYVDGDNYKKHNEAVVKGELTPQQIEDIYDSLNEGEFMIPSQIGLPEERFDKITSADHCWFVLREGDIESTDEKETVSITAGELHQAFLKAKGKWDDSKTYYDKILCSDDNNAMPNSYYWPRVSPEFKEAFCKMEKRCCELADAKHGSNHGWNLLEVLKEIWDMIVQGKLDHSHNFDEVFNSFKYMTVERIYQENN